MKKIIFLLFTTLFSMFCGGVIGFFVWNFTDGSKKAYCCTQEKFEHIKRCENIKFRIGDGKDCAVWYNPFLQIGIGFLAGGFIITPLMWDFIVKKYL